MFTEKTVISDLLEKNPKLEQILLSEGLHCTGCPAARGETIAEACEIHGLDTKQLLTRLNNVK